MHILIVKLSSLGDLIHTFPALTDAKSILPDIQFDWLVDKSFSAVPAWHPGVSQVIPIDLRAWRKQDPGEIWQHWKGFTANLQRQKYDLIIDAQGLLKSALLARKAHASVAGYARKSIREPVASFLYQQKYTVSRDQHAIKRIRSLFAQALDYSFDEKNVNYGLTFSAEKRQNRILLLHGTTWPSKRWPETYWAELADLVHQAGFKVCLTWHSPDERLRAQRIIHIAQTGELLPAMQLTEMAEYLVTSSGVVGLDSGLAHIAAAVGTPAVTLYGPTDTGLTGAVGRQQKNLSVSFDCAPCMQRECHYPGQSAVKPACFTELTAHKVWQALQQQMAQKK